ncbi:MAG: XdhC/CoxI family protein [Thermoleophilia bacterium]|nr:XdhC/CoxI family protein [Thermoleophilia bacterium]
MNDETLTTATDWVARGDSVALATVVRTYRSAPRPIGSVFAVSSSGEMAGSVSGGCVEGDIYGAAQAMFADNTSAPRLIHYGISDDLALEVGLACGGELWVSLDHFRARPVLRRGAIATIFNGDQNGEGLVFDADSGALTGTLAGDLRTIAEQTIADAVAREESIALDLEGELVLFVESIHPAPRVIVVGAVDTAEALCRMTKTLGWRTAIVDPRAKFATPERIPSADVILTSWPDKAYSELALEAADHLVVLTHDPKIDDPAISLALNLDVGYVGALGSRRTQEKRNARLRESGNTDEQIGRIYGPVGLDIGAHSPAETAVAILAEIIGYRSGRGGQPLKHTTGRIHPSEETAS